MIRYVYILIVSLIGGYAVTDYIVGPAVIGWQQICATSVAVLMIFGAYGGMKTVVVGHVPIHTRVVMAGFFLGCHTFLWLRHCNVV